MAIRYQNKALAVVHFVRRHPNKFSRAELAAMFGMSDVYQYLFATDTLRVGKPKILWVYAKGKRKQVPKAVSTITLSDAGVEKLVFMDTAGSMPPFVKG